MRTIYGLQSVPPQMIPTVMTVGNFDGIHLGHQELIKRVIETAKDEAARGHQLEAGLMTFDPHPMKVLVPQKHLRTIFELSDRIAMAEQLGLDFMVIEPFSRELSQLAPGEFFEKLLLKQLNVKFLFVGHDFTFGRNRSGTLEVLGALCKAHGVNLTVVPPVKLGQEVISSTKIRDAVNRGDMEKASQMLGRDFFLKGVVEKGAGRGKKIGFPTANLFTTAELLPKLGVYVTTTEVKGRTYRSVTNVGENPTFKDLPKHPVMVETFIMDFDQDIYGETIKVSFQHYLRAEVKFHGVPELITQIKKDVEEAKQYHDQKAQAD